MKRIIFLFATTVAVANNSFGQGENYARHYRININAGALTTLARRGPKEPTAVSPVRFLHPVSKSFSASFDISVKRNVFVGLLLGYEEFNFGYEAERQGNGSGLSIESGLLAANDIIGVFKAGVRVSKCLHFGKRFWFEGGLAPHFGVYPYSTYIEDTSNNQYARSPRSSVWYIVKPSYQNNNLKFLLAAQASISYSLSNNLDAGILVSYQQGFSPIVKDTTTIVRPYTAIGSVQHDYWTIVNGSAIGFQFHIGYKF